MEHFIAVGEKPQLLIISKWYRSAQFLASLLELNDKEWHHVNNMIHLQGRTGYIYTIYHDYPDNYGELSSYLVTARAKFISHHDLERIVNNSATSDKDISTPVI